MVPRNFVQRGGFNYSTSDWSDTRDCFEKIKATSSPPIANQISEFLKVCGVHIGQISSLSSAPTIDQMQLLMHVLTDWILWSRSTIRACRMTCQELKSIEVIWLDLLTRHGGILSRTAKIQLEATPSWLAHLKLWSTMVAQRMCVEQL